MKKLCLLLALLCTAQLWGQTSTVQGHTFLGGIPATTSGMNSSNNLNGIIPGASVTVYLTGTQTKATIYADGSNTPLSNPFFSNASGATNPGGFIFWAKNGQGLDVQAQGGQQNASCTTSPLCYTQATMLLVDVTPGNSSAALPLQHNSSSTGILQTLLNFCDNGICGTAVPAGQQQVTFGPDSTGGWAAWTASTAAQFQVQQAAPAVGQFIIVYPTSFTISDCQTQGGFGSATNTSGTANSKTPSGSSCVVTVTWNFTAPTNPAIGNITSVYPFVIAGSTITTGAGPGTANEAHVNCTGTGVTDPNVTQAGTDYSTVTFPQAQYTSSTSLTVSTANFNAMTCSISSGTTDGIVGQPNGVKNTAALVGAYVYYTGTPITQPTYLNIQYPLLFDGTTNTLSFVNPFGDVDTGTANTYVIDDSAYSGGISSGSEISFLAANPSTSTAPTLNLNGFGAWPIVNDRGGAALSSGDISAYASTGYIAKVRLGGNGTSGFVWRLENPQVSGAGGISGMTAGQVPIAATATTVTSSKALSGAGVGITTGPTSATLNDCVKFAADGSIVDAGSACGSGSGGTPAGLTGAGQYNASGSFGGTNVIYLAPPVQPPGTVTATPSTTGGTLAAGTYYVIATATNATGQTIGSPEASATTTGTTGSIALTWTAITGATGYRVYVGTSSGGEGQYFTTATASFTVTTATGTAGTVPAQNTTVDMGAEINSAVTALGANPSGGVIHLPPGSSNIATAATISDRRISLQGYGREGSKLTCTLAGNCLTVHPDYFQATGADKFAAGGYVGDFSFSGNAAANQVLLLTEDSIGWQYNQIYFDNASASTDVCMEMDNLNYWTEFNNINISTGYNCYVGLKLYGTATGNNSFGYNQINLALFPNSSGYTGLMLSHQAGAAGLLLYGGTLTIGGSVAGTAVSIDSVWSVGTLNNEPEWLTANLEGAGTMWNVASGNVFFWGYADYSLSQGTAYSNGFFVAGVARNTQVVNTSYLASTPAQTNNNNAASFPQSAGNFCPNVTDQCTSYFGKDKSTTGDAVQVGWVASPQRGALGLINAASPFWNLEWDSSGNVYLPYITSSSGIYTDSSGTIKASPSGTVPLVAGTATVSNSAACAAGSSCIYTLTHCAAGGTMGILSVGTVTAGTSFVINSSSATDTSQVCWRIN